MKEERRQRAKSPLGLPPRPIKARRTQELKPIIFKSTRGRWETSERRLGSRSILRRWVLLLSLEPEPEPNPEGKLLFLSSLYLEQTQRAALRDAHI